MSSNNGLRYNFNANSSSSVSFSDSSSSSEESDVPEHMGLAPFAWDPTEKLKQANKKLQELELPTDETKRPGSKLTFNETVAVKSSSSTSSRTGSPDKISEKSEKSDNSEKSTDSDTESRILKLENKIKKKKAAAKEKSEQDVKSKQNTKSDHSETASKSGLTLQQNKKTTQFQKSSSYTDDFETENSSKRSNSVSSYNKNYTHPSRNTRPVSAPANKRKMSSGGKPLWNPDNPPETPHDLPAYMRPKSTGSLLNRNKSRGSKMGQSQFMQAHHLKNKEDFPHINSAYQMPAEQRRAASKRNQLRKEREREEQLAVEEEEKTQVQTAHEVWVAWYETRYAQEKEEKLEVREKNRRERRERMGMESMRENALTEGGLDYATWCKAKEKREKSERKLKEEEENKKNESTPTPLEKMKDNDRAFRRWLRKSNRRKKDEDKLDREKERLRRIELRREARAQKALAAIRAAQDVALKNRTFVF